MRRVPRFMRVYIINAPTVLWMPVMILAIAAVITYVIFAIIPNNGQPMYGGGLNAPLWYFAVMGGQTVGLTLPFALALGVTRREYAIGSFLTAAVCGLALAALVTIGAAVEAATQGWGNNGYFFYLPWMWADGWFGALLLAASITWLFYVVGFGLIVVKNRTSMAVMWIVIGALLLAIVGVVGVVVAAVGWVQFFDWFNWFGPLSTAAALTALSALVGGTSYLALRRVVIR